MSASRYLLILQTYPTGGNYLTPTKHDFEGRILTREQFLLSIEINISSFLALTLVLPRDSNIPAVIS